MEETHSQGSEGASKETVYRKNVAERITWEKKPKDLQKTHNGSKMLGIIQKRQRLLEEGVWQAQR